MKALVFLFILVASASAATYYVDQSGGDDGALGTSAGTAWKTISKVNATALSAGDSVLFKRGEQWHEVLTPLYDGTAVARITYSAYGTGSNPQITSTVSVPVDAWTNAVSSGTTNIWGANLETLGVRESWAAVYEGNRLPNYWGYAVGGSPYTAPYELTNMMEGWTYSPLHGSNGIGSIYFRRDAGAPDAVMEAGARTNAILVQAKSYLTFENLDVFGPGGSDQNTSINSEHTFYLSNCANIIVRNCRLAYAQNWGLLVWSNQNTTVSGVEGFQSRGVAISMQEGCTNCVVTNCYVHHTGNLPCEAEQNASDKGCIGLNYGVDCRITGNTLGWNAVTNSYAIDAVISVLDSTGTIIDHNEIYQAGGPAVQVAELSHNTAVCFNYVTNWGVKASTSTAYFDWAIKIGGGGGGSSNVWVYNNLIVDGLARTNNFSAAIASTAQAENTNERIFNNISYGNVHSDFNYDLYPRTSDAGIVDWVVMRNCFYRVNGTDTSVYWRPAAGAAKFAFDHIVGGSAGYLENDHPEVSLTVITDPLLDFTRHRLLYGSPCIGKGVDQRGATWGGALTPPAPGPHIGPWPYGIQINRLSVNRVVPN